MDARIGLSTDFAGVGFSLLLAACGARSSLPACTQPGATRECENACGAGSQVCEDGQWGPCEVAPMSRACSNACGQGSQSCVDGGGWSMCAVPPAQRSCTNGCGPGFEECLDGGWQACDAAAPGPPTFVATIHDLHATHPDFEPDSGINALDPGIVAPDLGADDLPVYAATHSSSTHGAADFDQWYHDTPGINLRGPPLPLPMKPSASDSTVYGYDNGMFFPIDNQLFGNEGRPHNYDFTVALSAMFRYHGGETLRFGSDDDSFIFVNRKLAVDLGGVHQLRYGSVALDPQRGALGLIQGGIYPMHVFYAERHVFGASLYVDLPAADFAVCADGGLP